NKPSGIASIDNTLQVSGNLTVTSGTLDVNAQLTADNNIVIGASGIVNGKSNTIIIKGNWNNSGTFNPGTGKVLFNGAGDQTSGATNFNNLEIDKASGTFSLLSDISVNNSSSLINGVVDLSTYTANRVTGGGAFTMASGTSLLIGGANNFPQNFSVLTIDNNSTVHYNGSVTQSVYGATYGYLIFSNGGSNAKTLAASGIVNGDLTINSGAELAASSYTLELYSNWTNNGTFTPGTGTVVLNGVSKNLSGATIFNKMTVNGSYTVNNYSLTFNDLLFIAPGASMDVGASTITVSGDMTNAGTISTSGVTTFTGNQVQNIRLLGTYISTASGVINF
ncbi:MAG: hypothetical protein HC867_06790, partial [Bacteroidia bacterium]|nr:hypothetical protein [Bacteroidia bacterium]